MTRPDIASRYVLNSFKVELNGQDSKKHKEKYRLMLHWQFGEITGDGVWDIKTEERFVNTLEEAIEVVRNEGEGDL